MGIITLVVLGLTAVGLLFGTLFGLCRGRDRALLRLILVVLSAVLALALRSTVVDVVMNLEFDGATLKETMLEGFNSGDQALPEGLVNLVFALLNIVIGFVAYFILLFALRFLTWLLLFPFLKLIIRKIENKRARKAFAANAPDGTVVKKLKRKDRKKLVKKHRGAGALIGLLQGVLTAFFLFAPLTGLLVQVDKISKIEIQGEVLMELPEEIDISEYADSLPGKIFNKTGHWYYVMLTSTTDKNGNEVSLDATLNTVTTLLDVVDITTTLEEDLSILTDEEATPQERIDALDGLGDKLVSIGSSMEELDQGTMDMIKDLVNEMAGEEVEDEELEEVMEMLTPEFFTKAGEGVKAIAKYEDVKLNEETPSQTDINNLVNAAYESLDLVGELELEVEDDHKDMFKTAIEDIDDLSAEDKETLFNMFGIN